MSSNGWLNADWTGWLATEAQQASLESNGIPETVDLASEAGVHPAEAFVATVLDGAPNLCTVAEGRIVTLA